MAAKIDLGPHGKTVAANILRIRTETNLGYAELVRRLAEQGNTIAPQGLRRIEREERRVDIDDLIHIATALKVTPKDLLTPPPTKPTTRDTIIAVLNEHIPRNNSVLNSIDTHALADDICEALHLDGQAPTP